MTRTRCPCCYRPAAYRVPRHLDEQISLKRLYRCGTSGRWLYLHEIPVRGEEPAEVSA